MIKEPLYSIKITKTEALKESDEVSLLLECMRYANLIWHDDNSIIMRPPRQIKEDRSQRWAEQNANKIRSFGLSVEVITQLY